MSMQLSNSERSILAHLSKKKGMTVEELAVELSMDYQKTMPDLELLRKQGLATLGLENRYKPFRQVIVASITVKGRAFLQQRQVTSTKISNSQSVGQAKIANKSSLSESTVLHYPQYARIYESIPVAKRIADSLVDSIYSSYSVTNAAPEQEAAIHSFFSRNNFDQMFRKIVEDTVTFGDSYLEITREDPLTLLRIDPVSSIFKHGWTEDTERDAVYEQILESIEVEGEREIGKDRFIQFSHKMLQTTFGLSAFGEGFLTWAALERAVNLIESGNGDRAVSNRDYYEEQVLVDGLPETLLTKNAHLHSLPLETKKGSKLDLAVQDRRRELKRVVEKRLFPIILASQWDQRNWPEFTIEGNLHLID
jgi:hypothetical protein